MTLGLTLDLPDRRWWHGIVDLEPLAEGGVRLWRVPPRDPRFRIGLVYGATPAGVRMVLRTSATKVRMTLRTDPPEVGGHSSVGPAAPAPAPADDPSEPATPATAPTDGRSGPGASADGHSEPAAPAAEPIRHECGPVDVVVDGTLAARVAPDAAGRLTADLPGRPVLVELWLPRIGCHGVARVELTGDPTPSPVTPPTVRLLTHGSSITMGNDADGPSTTWPARVARSLGADLLNLSYAGQCLLDPPVARLIRDTPADLITLCLGINVHGQSSHTARSLLPAVIGFVETVRDGHPGTPLVVISPIAVRPARDVANRAGLTVSAIRDIVHDAVSRIRETTGDRGLHLVDGRDVLGEHQLDLLADEVHPTDAGFAAMAEALLPRLSPLLYPTLAKAV